MLVDVSWIEAGLETWEPGRWLIGNIVPAGYSCYLRILHPAQRDGDGSWDDVTWREGCGDERQDADRTVPVQRSAAR